MIELDALLHDLGTLPPLRNWLQELPKAIKEAMNVKQHGNLPRWEETLKQLPPLLPTSVDLNTDTIRLGTIEDCSEEDRTRLEQGLKELHPWRKGPYNLFGVEVDTEWRSDWKWQRVLPHLSPLQGRAVLDVGCGSGYHCWRMLGEGARLVLGIDPNPHFLAQFHALKRYTEALPVHLLPFKSEQLPGDLQAFDTVFSMGVLYHRRSPLDHLLELKGFLKPGGELVLETLVVPGEAGRVLVPEDRYAQMRNVWFLPTPPELEKWLRRCGFQNVRTVDITTTSPDEQRATPWMTFQSLTDFLDPNDPQKTIEGYPAPTRATLVATKPL